MAPTLFRILLALVAVYAFLRGTRDERLVGTICVAGALATHLVISPLSNRFASVETPVMLVDIAVFSGFLVAMLFTAPLSLAQLAVEAPLWGRNVLGGIKALLPRPTAEVEEAEVLGEEVDTCTSHITQTKQTLHC